MSILKATVSAEAKGIRPTVKRGQRFRIDTLRDSATGSAASGSRLIGSDVRVFLVMDDGSEVFCPNVESASWRVDSRHGKCRGTFVVADVEVDVEGVAEDALRFRDEENSALKARIAELERTIRDLKSRT
jgi:hypothetical protein